jgi:dihydrodipicolinate synthase/N-acetylneuraminate lyase
MLKAINRRDYVTAQALGQRLQALADVIFSAPVTDYRSRTKEALKMIGVIDHTMLRAPLLPVGDGEKAQIRDALMRAELL